VIRTVLQRQIVVVFLLTFGIATISSAQQSDKAPPKELVQFINDATRRGVNEGKIKQQAVAIGWSSAMVDEAIAHARSAKAASTATDPASGTNNTLNPSAPSFEVPSTAPESLLNESSNAGARPGTTAAGPSTSFAYQIGSGDILQITVWKEPEASIPSVVVRPDGKITVPLIKEVEVVGLTPMQVEQIITERLSKFITDANVTVLVTAMGSKKIYVTGAVKKEGPVPYTYGMTILQALSEAGGLTDYAKRKKIYVLRTESGRDYRLDFNYDEVLKGERMEQNILLLPNDTLVVPN